MIEVTQIIPLGYPSTPKNIFQTSSKMSGGRLSTGMLGIAVAQDLRRLVSRQKPFIWVVGLPPVVLIQPQKSLCPVDSAVPVLTWPCYHNGLLEALAENTTMTFTDRLHRCQSVLTMDLKIVMPFSCSCSQMWCQIILGHAITWREICLWETLPSTETLLSCGAADLAQYRKVL